MQNVVTMSENLRAAMRLDMEKCEEECRRKDDIIERLREDRDELIRQHSRAREEFLQEAREREHIQTGLLQELEQMRAKMTAVHAELDAIRSGTRHS
jgi:SMC interacting uncharacterized protein involved in chromosome segregation